jgi:hypothetical protein
MRTLNEAVLYGIVVYVIDVAYKIVLVSYPVFPESPLPYTILSMFLAGF